MTEASGATNVIHRRYLDLTMLAKTRADVETKAPVPHVIDGFLSADLCAKVFAFAVHEAIWNSQLLTYGGELVNQQTWEMMPPDDRLSRESVSIGTSTRHCLSENLQAFLRVRSAFAHEIGAWVMAATGRSLALDPDDPPGPLRRMIAGDFIGPHDDLVSGRIVGLVLHFSRQLSESAGGLLQVWRNGQLMASIPSAFNRAVLIHAMPGTVHEVTPIKEVDNGMRLTIAAWYREAP